jgi:hypothetical protein
MTDETGFTVLVSTDGGDTWRLHRGVEANTTVQACKRVQKDHYAESAHAMFYATQRFTPRKMVEKLVPRLGMEQVDLDSSAPQPASPMPHESGSEADA